MKKIMNKGTNTGFNGVTKRVRKGRTAVRYQAYLAVKGNTTHIGTYNTLQEAVGARTEFITSLI